MVVVNATKKLYRRKTNVFSIINETRELLDRNFHWEALHIFREANEVAACASESALEMEEIDRSDHKATWRR